MARQVINVSTVPNDRNGDPLRVAFTKINENFAELYNASPDSGEVNWTPDTGNEWRIVEASGHSIVTLGEPTTEEFTLASYSTHENSTSIDISRELGDPVFMPYWSDDKEFESLVVVISEVILEDCRISSYDDQRWVIEVSDTITVNEGDPITFIFTTQTTPQVWFDPADTELGDKDFIGAHIHYSAYVQDGWNEIGWILYTAGQNEESFDTTYQRSVMGPNGESGEFYRRSSDNPNVLVFKGDGTTPFTAYIQWKGILFYSADRVE